MDTIKGVVKGYEDIFMEFKSGKPDPDPSLKLML